jgi:ABC-type antimicrobial peptide transport system permease subunit
VGVVKDFHFNSMHIPINALVLFLDETDQHGGYILVKTKPGKAREAVAALSATWSRLNPSFPFSYQFADEEFNKLYKSDEMVSRLSNWFAFLAILISCLGLLGLVIFTTNQRTKEIGIRKVLGANSASLFNLVIKEFVVLVVIALLIASPLAWLFMNNWLQDYAYRITINWWIFLVAGITSIAITILTISFQTLKVIFTNPVKTLRTE